MAAANVMANNGYGSFADPKHQGREMLAGVYNKKQMLRNLIYLQKHLY